MPPSSPHFLSLSVIQRLFALQLMSIEHVTQERDVQAGHQDAAHIVICGSSLNLSNLIYPID